VLAFLPTDSRSAGSRINRLGEDGDADSAPRIRIGMPPPHPGPLYLQFNKTTQISLQPLAAPYGPLAVIFLGSRLSPGHEKKNYAASLIPFLYVLSSVATTVTISLHQLFYHDDVTYFFQFQTFVKNYAETVRPFLYVHSSVATTVTISLHQLFYHDDVTYFFQFQNLCEKLCRNCETFSICS
jgi:hypothetical protein